MNGEQKEKAIQALVGFIERASREGATPEEVQALPEIAKVLLAYLPVSASNAITPSEIRDISSCEHHSQRVQDVRN